MGTREFNTILLEFDKQCAILRFNRPEHSNAYNEEMGLELLEILANLADPEVRSVVITGKGKDFSVGFDLNIIKDHLEEAPLMFRRATGSLNRVVTELRRLPKPVIAAVNGVAAGAGFSFALACDFILAAETASFSSSSMNVGISPDGGLSYFLTRLVGPQKCAELVMTGKSISAKKAFDWGILSGVVPLTKLLEEAKNLGTYFANGPTLALGRAKRLIDLSIDHSLEEQLEEERQALIEISNSHDFREGLAKWPHIQSKPHFEGR